MRIFIEPTEPLLFRRGHAFDAGESNFADSMFPPTPETLQGAIRAMIATHSTHIDGNTSLAARFETDILITTHRRQEQHARWYAVPHSTRPGG